MRKRTLRTLLKFSFPIDVALFGLVVLDYLLWDSAAMMVLLSLLAVLLIAVVVLLVLEERAKYLRINVDATPEPPITIFYGAGDHGRP